MSKRQIVSHLLFAVFCSVACTVVFVLLAIWTGDERWGATGGVSFMVGVVALTCAAASRDLMKEDR